MSLRLRYTKASPFVRKVRVFASEAGLSDRVELVPTDPWAADTDLKADNPILRVPTLITGDGIFVGSLSCCEYLDTLHGGEALIPSGPLRWPSMQIHAIADGLMECAVSHVVEQLRRPTEYIFEGHLQRQRQKIANAVAVLEDRLDVWSHWRGLAPITAGCALAYLDFRLPQLDWRTGHGGLTHWYSEFANRRSMLETKPN